MDVNDKILFFVIAEVKKMKIDSIDIKRRYKEKQDVQDY